MPPQLTLLSVCTGVLLSISSLVSAGSKLDVLLSSLETDSIQEHLVFYKLYPDSPQGKEALQRAWKLLSGGEELATPTEIKFSSEIISDLVDLINLSGRKSQYPLDEKTLHTLNEISKKRLQHHGLEGHQAESESEVLALPPEEIDLARAIILSLHSGDKELQKILRHYEAQLDLMALQILAKLPAEPTEKEILKTTSDFIFREMRYRFPPESLYAKDIDEYTFLPSVLDSRQGVCLGVCVLYLSLSQRLGVNLEIVTPPGHIYIRHVDGTEIYNIETTARGVNLPSETYLGVNTRSLQMRNIKEVVGLSYVNQAAVFWQRDENQKALEAYKKGLPYLPGDKLLQEFMGYQNLFTGKKSEGKKLLKAVKNHIPNEAVVGETVASDYLNGRVSIEGIRAIYMRVNETRESILEKQRVLQEVVKRHPQFRAGWFHLGITWLQLRREREALEVLKHLHQLDPNNPVSEYYLALLSRNRLDYQLAWKHLKNAERIVSARNHSPKGLRQLRLELLRVCPES